MRTLTAIGYAVVVVAAVTAVSVYATHLAVQTLRAQYLAAAPVT